MMARIDRTWMRQARPPGGMYARGATGDGRVGTRVSGLAAREEERAQASRPHATEATDSSSALPQRISLAILLFAYWCVDIVSPALPAIQESLALSATGAGLVFSVFFAGRLISNLPAAWLVERVGPKWTAVGGSAALLLGSGLAAVAASQAMLLPARGIQGVGVALLATAGLLSVLRALPGGGAAMTAFNLSTGAGGSAGLLTGGYLTAEFGWRAVFWLSTVISGVLLAGTMLDRVRAVVVRTGRTIWKDASTVVRPSRYDEVVAVAANLLVFVNYSILVVSLPLLGTEKFGFDASQVGMMLLFVNLIHLGSTVPMGGMIRKAGT